MGKIITALIILGAGITLQANAYEPPRMPDGTPDFQGVWTNASLTRMTRAEGFSELVIPASKIEELNYNSYYNSTLREDSKVTNPDAPAPEKGGNIKGYNNFWIDPGSSYGQVNGEYRSSWIVEPQDGSIPYSAEGRRMRMLARRPPGVGAYDGPEVRSLGDRCLISFGSSAGPPMNNVMYNNHYQFVQTPENVVIMVEMNHDARIIDINGKHNPSPVKEWFGSSVGKWEGDTLVVETVNIHPIQEKRGAFPISEKGKVIERFTRVGDDKMLYEFTVTDPTYYSQPWSGEMSFRRDNERIFEYACHEGNYAMEGILRGERMKERAALGKAAE